jgi:hypothetical protein
MGVGAGGRKCRVWDGTTGADNAQVMDDKGTPREGIF